MANDTGTRALDEPTGGTYSDIAGSHLRQKDEHTLARLGKKQVLKWWTSRAVIWLHHRMAVQHVCIHGNSRDGIHVPTPNVVDQSPIDLTLVHSAPIAGGQYFWVSMLAPKGYKRFASYITGWLTSLAWVAVLATGSIFVGTIIQGLIILNNPSYEQHAWHGALLCWAVITVAVFINTVVSGLLPIIEGVILIFHVLGFVAVLIPLLYLSPHGSSASVFRTALNEGGWPTQGMSYCVGFIGNVATFVGKFA
ncbi:MAG: hypothetical protein Q9168_004605 [Polycauliona sp. 1 TL-2023]